MENITATKQEVYENILQQIDQQREIQDNLKKDIEKINSKIVATYIVKKSDVAKEQIFHATVKLFSNLYHIHELYQNQLTNEVFQNVNAENKVFYLTELYISRLFQERILSQKWLLNIAISNDNYTISKSINIKNTLFNPILIIIPFDKSIEPSKVDVSLVSPSLNCWPLLKLETITIDISYHFKTYISKSNTTSSEINSLASIYKNNDENVPKPEKIIKYSIPCEWTFDQFYESIIKHCYHCVDISKTLLNAKDKDNVTITISVDNESMIKLELDVNKKIFKIEATKHNMYMIKQHVYREIRNTCKILPTSLSKELLKEHKSTLLEESPEIRVLKNIYNELRD